MIKDFSGWYEEKQALEKEGHDTLVFHEREIWWCSIGINLGHEQDGKNELFERPVVVVRKFNNRLAWVVPLSTKAKEGEYYFQLEHDGRKFTAILSQLRLLSVKRFRRFIRKVSPMQSRALRAKLKALL